CDTDPETGSRTRPGAPVVRSEVRRLRGRGVRRLAGRRRGPGVPRSGWLVDPLRSVRGSRPDPWVGRLGAEARAAGGAETAGGDGRAAVQAALPLAVHVAQSKAIVRFRPTPCPGVVRLTGHQRFWSGGRPGWRQTVRWVTSAS